MQHSTQFFHTRKSLLIVAVTLVAASTVTWFMVTLGTSRFRQSNIDEIIRRYARSQSASAIKDFTVTEKKVFIDNQGARWLRFSVNPLPESVTDSAYGVMKNVNGTWQGIGIGTCCIEKQLPQDVAKALGFPSTNEQ